MRKPSQLRRLAKRTGIGLCTVIAIVWLLSGWWEVHYISPSGIAYGIEAGGAYQFEVAQFLAVPYDNSESPFKAVFRHAIRRHRSSDPPVVSMPYWIGSVQLGDVRIVPIVFLPCWIPLFLVALPTGILCWLDRRFPSGQCQKCAYDLTGNTSGRCPECGGAV